MRENLRVGSGKRGEGAARIGMTLDRRWGAPRRVRRKVRDVMLAMMSAAFVADAQADDGLPELPPLPIPYLDLQRSERIRTRGGRYFATDATPLKSAIRLSGPKVGLDITDADLYVYFSSAHGIYARKGATALAHLVRATTTELAAHGHVADGGTIRLDRSVVKTRADDAYGVLSQGVGGSLQFVGGTISTLGERAYGARASTGAKLELGEIVQEDGTHEHVRIVTDAAHSAGVVVDEGAELVATGVDIETHGAVSPALVVDHAKASVSDARFVVGAGGVPFVVVRRGGSLAIGSSDVDLGEREEPVFRVDSESVLTLDRGSWVRAPMAILIARSMSKLGMRGAERGVVVDDAGNDIGIDASDGDGTGSAGSAGSGSGRASDIVLGDASAADDGPVGDVLPGARIVVANGARVEGAIENFERETARLEVRERGEVRSALSGRIALELSTAGMVLLPGSARVDTVSNSGGTVGFESLAPARQTLVVDGSLTGMEPSLIPADLSALSGRVVDSNQDRSNAGVRDAGLGDVLNAIDGPLQSGSTRSVASATETGVNNAAALASLRLRTTLNEGGRLDVQQTDRILVSGDVSGVHVLDIATTGVGAQTDTNGDGAIQASEGISVAQVAGRASVGSFVLPGGVLAVGAYQYELMAFAPGASDRAQRLVSGDEGFWDFRLATRKMSDSIVDGKEPASPGGGGSGGAPIDGGGGNDGSGGNGGNGGDEGNSVSGGGGNSGGNEVGGGSGSDGGNAGSAGGGSDGGNGGSGGNGSHGGNDESGGNGSNAENGGGNGNAGNDSANGDAGEVDESGTDTHTNEAVSADASEPPATEKPRPTSPHAAGYLASPLATSDLLRTALLTWTTRDMWVDGLDPLGTPSSNHAKASASFFGARASYRGALKLGSTSGSPGLEFEHAQRGIQLGMPVYESTGVEGATRIDVGLSIAESRIHGAHESSDLMSVGATSGDRSAMSVGMRAGSGMGSSSASAAGDRVTISAAGMGAQFMHRHGQSTHDVATLSDRYRPYGFYERAIVKLDALSFDVRNGARAVAASGGTSLSLLGEVGFAIATPLGFDVAPALTAVYVDQRFGNTVDSDGYAVALQRQRSTAVRMSARVMRTLKVRDATLVPYVQTGVTFSGGPSMSHRIGDTMYSNAPAGSSLNTAFGVAGRIGKRAVVRIDIEVDHAFGQGMTGTRADGGVQWIF